MSMPSAPALLDTAIPMYAAGAPHPCRDACQWLMTEIAAGRARVVIDAEVIQEILHRYGALGRYADAVNMAQDLMTLIPQVLPVTAADVQTAVKLFQQYAPQGVRARDTIHAAIVQNHGLTHVISSDTHFDLISGLTRLDPIVLHQSASQAKP
jgi:predicted nucleic acid-binding protein